jgi:hypothetical protein
MLNDHVLNNRALVDEGLELLTEDACWDLMSRCDVTPGFVSGRRLAHE